MKRLTEQTNKDFEDFDNLLDLDAIESERLGGDSTSTSPGGMGLVAGEIYDAATTLGKQYLTPQVLVPAGIAALGTTAVLSRPKKTKDDKEPGFLRRTAGTLAGLGLTGAAAYGAHKMLKPRTVFEDVSDRFFSPSGLGAGFGSLAGGLAAFPLADALTSNIKNPALKAVANIGSKALFSTGLTAGGGYAGFKAGEAVENEMNRRERERLEKERRNQYLPNFYYDRMA